jgi:epoxyqueuosine reductase
MGGFEWTQVLAALVERGWTARVVPVERLDEARARVVAQLAPGALPQAAADHLLEGAVVELPAGVAQPRSVVVGAVARPLTQAVVRFGGVERVVPVPPHYAGYRTVPRLLEAAVRDLLAPAGHAAVLCGAPLKTLAAGAGLARYGRNNVTYVPGLGSYLLLAACVTDAPPPADAAWGVALPLDRCERCSACLRACPTGAIRADRFLLHTERCLTFLNESEQPFPAWVEPSWHTCAIGCIRCQQVCPENAAVELLVEPPPRFDEAETAAVLAGEHTGLTEPVREKLRRCGLDYSAPLIARNLRTLLGA